MARLNSEQRKMIKDAINNIELGLKDHNTAYFDNAKWLLKIIIEKELEKK